MKKITTLVLACLLVATVACTAYAVPLGIGGSAAATGADSPLGSLITSITVPFTGAFGYVGGSVTENVLINSTGMLFQYYVNCTGSAITSVTASLYAGFSTDLDGPTLASVPPHIPHIDMLSVGPIGSTVNFVWTNDWIDPGQNSGWLWVQTNAPWYEPGIFSVQGTDTATISMLGPSRIVPEPGSAMLLGMGLLGFAGMIRRKFTA